jgi:glycerophosphoryl diester phosphodiesterase
MNGLILGHRGSPGELPENTMGSFHRAREVGADGVELDVRLTRDGVPVVIHDETVDRTTSGTGAVAELTWNQIAGMRVRSRRSLDREDEAGAEPALSARVPRLEEVARWAATSNAFLNVELKAPGTEKPSVEIIRSAGLMQRVLISSFIPAVIAEVGNIEPAARRYLLTEYWDTRAELALGACGAAGICLGERAATAHVLAALARDGIPFVVWTVDDSIRIRAILAAGAEAVITNEPAHAVAARAGMGG